jgi:hypothetical protein
MADLSTRPAAGRVVTVLVLGAAAAALGQWCFARGHAFVGGQYEGLSCGGTRRCRRSPRRRC